MTQLTEFAFYSEELDETERRVRAWTVGYLTPDQERLLSAIALARKGLRAEQEKAAACPDCERMEKELDNTILCWKDDKRRAESNWKIAQETIAALRSELKMTRDEWDYYKEQYRKATEDGRNTNSGSDRGGSVDSGVSSSVPPLTPLVDGINELVAGNEGKSVYVATDWLRSIADALERMEKCAKFYMDFDIDAVAYENDRHKETIATLRAQLAAGDELRIEDHREHCKIQDALRAENERLTKDLKNAVWSDSEECKMLTEANAALRSALEKVQECRDLYEAIEVTRAALGTPPKG